MFPCDCVKTLNLEFKKLKCSYDGPIVKGMRVSSVQKVVIEPTVLVSIMEQYKRGEGFGVRGIMLGALLGTISSDGSLAECTCSAPIVFSADKEDEKLWFDDLKDLCEFNVQQSPSECIIGWYMLGKCLDKFLKYVKKFTQSIDIPKIPSVLLSINNVIPHGQISISAYASTRLGTSFDSSDELYIPVTYSIKAINQTVSDLAKITNQIKENTPAIKPDFLGMEESIKHLDTLIESTLGYVKDVLKKNVSPNASIGREIMNAILSCITSNQEECNDRFESSIHDSLLIMYLATITKTQLNLSSELQRLV